MYQGTPHPKRSINYSPSYSSLSPKRTLFNSKSKGGLLLTLKKENLITQLQTQDKTRTPQSSSQNKIDTFNNSFSRRQLFRNQNKYIPQRNNYFLTDPKVTRNHSFSTFELDRKQSSLTTVGKIHKNNLTSFSPLTRTHVSFYHNSQKSSPSKLSSNINHMNPITNKFKNAKFLNFDSPQRNNSKSISKSQSPYFNKLLKSSKQQKSIQKLSAKNNCYKIKQSNNLQMQTPIKQARENIDSGSSNFKNLRSKVIRNNLQQGRSTISSKGIFQTQNKQNISSTEYSSILEPNQLKNLFIKKPKYECKQWTYDNSSPSIQNLQSKFNQISLKQKQQFFNLTPKISEQYSISDIYQLTESPIKFNNGNDKTNNGKLFSENDQSLKKSVYYQNLVQDKDNKIRRKLVLENQNQVSLLGESFILNQLMISLNTKKTNIKKPFNIALIRKCSPNLCLVRNLQTNLVFSMIKLTKTQSFTTMPSDPQFQQLCLQTYCQLTQFAFIQPFQYSLQQIFQMKLIQNNHLSQLIKKFQPIINKIKNNNKDYRINLKKLKERIVYTHGQFKLIPIVEKS